MYEVKMNEDVNVLDGKQRQLKGLDQKRKGKLIGDDLEVIQGTTNLLIGKLQEVYGLTKEEAENKIREYEL